MNMKRLEAENNFQYREAETIRHSIDEMKNALDKKKMYAIHENHTAEKESMEVERMKKISQSEGFWEQKLKEFNEKRENHLMRLREKHKEDFAAYERQIREEIPNKSMSLSKYSEEKFCHSQFRKSNEGSGKEAEVQRGRAAVRADQEESRDML
jgi:hypothetical protein